ncbi:polysaccharide biosynthesis/export family protein [Indioceanicola profundi]|uniref:polysaccharide biosynthesis/export family protein n=1 Tax=Indioceanicola profundi TaxID=2220096 RepID=UPI001CEDC2C0|nr:polysaccharide biosynthesis/export family protein [Indioceanicola profundi]
MLRMATVQSALRPFALVAALALGACGSSPPAFQEVAMAEPQAYTLGPGDSIRVIVFGHEQLSGEFSVDGSGHIALPLIGEVRATGASARELEKRIAQQLADGYVRDPRVSVEVLSFRPFYIIGEVNNPGQYPYAAGMTAVTAVALAGGYTYRAKQDQVVITRTVNGQKQEGTAPPNTPVMPDDVIRVPERYF